MNKTKQKTVSLIISAGILILFYFLNPEARDMSAFNENLSRSLRLENCIPVDASTTSTESSTFEVIEVIDGDTIEVQTPSCALEKVRMIGINTPETVDPRRPVQCFGKEASNKAKEILKDKELYLEGDPMQGERDKYGRLLAYAFIKDSTANQNGQNIFFNKYMIEEGYAYEYTYQTSYKYQKEFKEAETRAKENQKGLWNPAVCNGEV
jgi:micrococcal nuclease